MFKRLLWIVIVLLAFTAPVLAQGEDVATRLYFVDIIRTVSNRYPAHFGDPRHGFPADVELVGVRWSMLDYGEIDQGLVAADLSASQITYMASLPDVLAIPANIDNLVTAGNVATIQNALEARGIPGTWVNVGDSYRVVLREIAGYFDVVQKLSVLLQIDPTAQGYSLSATIGATALAQWQAIKARWIVLKGTMDEVSAYQQTRTEALQAGLSSTNFLRASLLVVLDFKGYDISAITASTTIRQVLRGLSAQNGQKQFTVGAFVL